MSTNALVPPHPALIPKSVVLSPKKTGRVELSLKESYDLCSYLVSRDSVPGETHASIAKEAVVELKNERINTAHVQSRFAALNLKLKPLTPTDPTERLAKLEAVLAEVAREQISACELHGVAPHPLLLEFVNGG